MFIREKSLLRQEKNFLGILEKESNNKLCRKSHCIVWHNEPFWTLSLHLLDNLTFYHHQLLQLPFQTSLLVKLFSLHQLWSRIPSYKLCSKQIIFRMPIMDKIIHFLKLDYSKQHHKIWILQTKMETWSWWLKKENWLKNRGKLISCLTTRTKRKDFWLRH